MKLHVIEFAQSSYRLNNLVHTTGEVINDASVIGVNRLHETVVIEVSNFVSYADNKAFFVHIKEEFAKLGYTVHEGDLSNTKRFKSNPATGKQYISVPVFWYENNTITFDEIKQWLSVKIFDAENFWNK